MDSAASDHLAKFGYETVSDRAGHCPWTVRPVTILPNLGLKRSLFAWPLSMDSAASANLGALVTEVLCQRHIREITRFRVSLLLEQAVTSERVAVDPAERPQLVRWHAGVPSWLATRDGRDGLAADPGPRCYPDAGWSQRVTLTGNRPRREAAVREVVVMAEEARAAEAMEAEVRAEGRKGGREEGRKGGSPCMHRKTLKETLQDKVAPATHQSHRHPCSAQRRSSAEAAASTARAARRSRRQKVVMNSGSAAVTDRRTMNICACLFLRSRRAHVIAAASPRDASPRRNVRQPSRSRSCSRCWLRRHAPRAERGAGRTVHRQ